MIVGIALACTVLWAATSSPPATAPQDAPRPPALVFLAGNGEPFARRGALRAAPVAAASLPDHVVAAFVGIEDRRFYTHHGVDVTGTARALAANIKAGRVVQGGSTITQQLVKNSLSAERRTAAAKLREALGALALERRLTKEDILSRYLNTVYFGDGAQGLGAAAQDYFGKSPAELSVGEAAMLAGLVKAPSRLNPRRNLAAAQARQAIVVQAMVETGFLSEDEGAAVAPAQIVRSAVNSGVGGYFADWLYPQAVAEYPPAYGQAEVLTTLDLELQRQAEAILRRVGGADGKGPQAALVAIRTDGAIVAMAGGRDYGESQFNRAAQARRQPGSAFKLFVYLAAFRNGATPDSLVSDEPLDIGGWTPANSDRQTHGLQTIEDAFARSSNLAAVRVSEHVGRDQVIRAARDLGLQSPLASVPSLPLGTSGVTLLELTAAYAAVNAGAYPVRASGTPPSTRDLAQTRMDYESERLPLLQVLNAAATRGTGRVAALPIPAFGKTGTSQHNRDAVFVGFAGDLTVGVWMGNDDETPMLRTAGGTIPAQIWREFMETALADKIAPMRVGSVAETVPLASPFVQSPQPDLGDDFLRSWGALVGL